MPGRTPDSEPRTAWHAAAAELAAWAEARLVNRPDAWGAYRPEAEIGRAYTRRDMTAVRPAAGRRADDLGNVTCENMTAAADSCRRARASSSSTSRPGPEPGKSSACHRCHGIRATVQPVMTRSQSRNRQTAQSPRLRGGAW
jgi:hypothetical protein